MTIICPSLSLILLNVSELNSPIKRYGVAEWGKSPTICYLQKAHFILKNTHRFKEKEWKKYFIQIVIIRKQGCHADVRHNSP